MNPINYVKNLISGKSGIDNDRIESQINNTRDTLINTSLPAVEKVIKKLSTAGSFQSEVYSLYNDAITNGVQSNIRGNMFVIIKEALESASNTLNLIDKMVSKEFTAETTAVSLTLSKANTLLLLDTVTLVSNYSRSMVGVVLTAEENRLLGEGRTELAGVTESEVKYLAEYREAFIRGLNIVLTPTDRIEERFAEIPEVVVSEVRSQAMTTSTHGNDKVDPLRFGLFQSKADPIWLIGTAWTQYQYNRYLAAKEQAAVIELRIERLRNLMDKKPNPRLAAIIEAREGQRDLKLAKVREQERKWNA